MQLYRAAFTETCLRFAPRQAPKIRELTDALGEPGVLMEGPGFTRLAESDQFVITMMLQHGSVGNNDISGRTVNYQLANPINDPDFLGLGCRLMRVALKGGAFRPGQALVPYLGGGLTRARYIGDDARFGFVDPVVNVCDGLYADEASEEIANAMAYRYALQQEQLYPQAQRLVPAYVKAPLGWAYFPGRCFNGRPLGVSIWGMSAAADQRPMQLLDRAAFVEAVGWMGSSLRRFHSSGFLHPFLHLGNLSSLESLIYAHDLAACSNLLRHRFTRLQFRHGVISDLWFSYNKMHGIAASASVVSDQQRPAFLDELLRTFSAKYAGTADALAPFWPLAFRSFNDIAGLNPHTDQLARLFAGVIDPIFLNLDARYASRERLSIDPPAAFKLDHQAVMLGIRDMAHREQNHRFNLAARLSGVLPMGPYPTPINEDDVQEILALLSSSKAPASILRRMPESQFFRRNTQDCQAAILAITELWITRSMPRVG